MTKAGKGRLMTALGAVFIAVSMWFLGKSFLAGVREAGGIENLLQFDIPLFLLSCLLLSGHLIIAGLTWHSVTKTAGGYLGFKKGFAIHFLSQVGKYVPGKVWAAMGKYTLSRNAGLTPAQTGHGLIFETVFIVLGCLMVALPLVPIAAAEAGMGGGAGVLAAAGLAILLIASVHPFFFEKIAGLAARLMKTNDGPRKYSFIQMMGLLPVYLGLFVFLGAAFWVLCLSFGLEMPFYPGVLIYPTAMGIGYLAIFAPGGLGARELTTVWLIHLIVPDCEPGLAELTVLVARLWVTLGEVAAFGISFGLFGIRPSMLKGIFTGNGLSDGDIVKRDEGQQV